MEEPLRIKKFRTEIIKAIPKFPNNKETISLLEDMGLSKLLVYFLTWAYRFVPQRPRIIKIEESVISDERWSTHQDEINIFLEKVKNAEDLTSHLSLKAHLKGFTPKATKAGPKVDKWEDKDFLLLTMGYHHFHLSPEKNDNGISKRGNDVIFARVTRELFEVIGIFDHGVFQKPSKDNMELTEERSRLWKIFDQHTMQGHPPGVVVAYPIITTSAHPLHIVDMASDYAYVMYEVEKMLVDKKNILKMYEGTGINPPNNPKFSWRMNGLDLGLFCQKTNAFFVHRYGPI